jgi:hypothetical protein
VHGNYCANNTGEKTRYIHVLANEEKSGMERKIAEFRGWQENCILNIWLGCLQTQTHKHCLALGKLQKKACRLLRSIISRVCFVTTIDSFFFARGFVANFRFRQNHPLSLPLQHPSCCYGNSIPSSAVYSGKSPSSHEPGRVGSLEAKQHELSLTLDRVLKFWKTMDITIRSDILHTYR